MNVGNVDEVSELTMLVLSVTPIRSTGALDRLILRFRMMMFFCLLILKPEPVRPPLEPPWILLRREGQGAAVSQTKRAGRIGRPACTHETLDPTLTTAPSPLISPLMVITRGVVPRQAARRVASVVTTVAATERRRRVQRREARKEEEGSYSRAAFPPPVVPPFIEA